MTAGLRPMPDDAVAAFVDRLRRDYVADRVTAGETREVAERQTEAQLADLMPSGRPAEGQLLFEVVEDGAAVGVIWLGRRADLGPGAWWVYDVEVDAAHRGRGLGRAAMELAEAEVRSMGGSHLGLNVFGANAVARRLYESLGYEPTSMQLRKQL